MNLIVTRIDSLGRKRQYSPCISISTRCWSASSVNLRHMVSCFQVHIATHNIPDKAVPAGHAHDGVEHELLQLKNGEMMRDSRSLCKPRIGLRKTATRSKLDTTGTRWPTKVLYPFGDHEFCAPVMDTVWLPGALLAGRVTEGTDDAQFSENALAELEMISGGGALLT